jgi:hypothetical protein
VWLKKKSFFIVFHVFHASAGSATVNSPLITRIFAEKGKKGKNGARLRKYFGLISVNLRTLFIRVSAPLRG